jgi:GT2 family glycosyltransferase
VTAPPRLAIIIVSYNARDDLTRCLASIHSPPPAVSHQITVVDNASSDGSANAVRHQWPAVTVLDAGGNVGFARANNLGIRSTASELLLLLNGDTIVPAGAIDRLVAVLDARPELAAVGPRIVDAAGRAELSFGRMITPLAELRQKLLVGGNDRGAPIISAYVDRLTRREQVVDWVSGACLLVRRADAETAGLLDERYFLYTEDVDFCAALRSRGRTVLFTPSAEIVHLRGRSASTARAATATAYRRSQLAFYEKHHPAWLPVLRGYLRLRGELPDN